MIDIDRIQAASTEFIRGINRRLILNLVRTRQPISRADMARVSGLQRSTVSLIVEQLIAEQWIVEGSMGRLPRGRRPTFLKLNEDRLIIGVDIRPIQTTVALADINGRFISQEAMSTPADPEVAMASLIERIQRLAGNCPGKKIEGIGVSLPGRVDQHSSRLAFAPNLNWIGFDIRTPLEQATGLEVHLENAANACVLAAVWFDSLESCQNLVVITVSEGIGSGIRINGQLAQGLNGMAGEFGHVSLDPDGPPCGCGGRGCWETLGSNRAALRYYSESDPKSEGLSFLDLLSRADRGDTRALKALQTMAHQLGRGLRMIVTGLAPDRIMIIGDLTRSWRYFGPIIEAEVHAQPIPGGNAPLITPAHEDGMARLRGTVALVLQKDFNITSESLI